MSTDKIIPAFFKAYYEFPDVVKKDKGQFKYAKLGTIMDAIGPILEKHGLLIYHAETMLEGIRVLRTYLVEKTSQQTLQTESMVILEEGGKRSALQEYGCAMSYQKRYNIMNLLNLTPEDDNENDGYSYQNRPYNKENIVRHSSSPATEGQLKFIKSLREKHSISPQELLTRYNLNGAQDLTAKVAAQIITDLKEG